MKTYAKKILAKPLRKVAATSGLQLTTLPRISLPLEVKSVIQKANDLRTEQRFTQALELLYQSLESHPNQPKTYIALSKIYRDLRMHRKAQEMLAEAILIDPTDAEAPKHLASFIKKKSVTPVKDSIADIMLFVKQLGFEPGTIFDIGVNTGTPGLFDFFPNAKLLMVDPIVESEPFMQHIQSLYEDAHYQIVAAGAGEKEVVMSVYPSYGGSGIADISGRHNGSVDRTVTAKRIDELAREYNAKGPYVIKVDVEGGEMHVLEGATGILPQTEILILETRFKPFASAPDLTEVMAKLREWGFLPWDFIDRNYNDNDGILKQCDLIAVKEEGFFRTKTEYRQFVAMKAEQMDHIIGSKLRSRENMLQNITKNKV